MLDDLTYREWTKIFNPSEGSYCEGKWEEGQTIHFLGPDGKGNISGLYSRVASVKPYEFLSLQHLGELIDGKEKPWPSPEEKMFENYSFTEHDGITDLEVTMDTADEWKESSQPAGPRLFKN